MKNIDIEELRNVISASSATTSIYLGGDSKRFRKNGVFHISFARVVVIHMDSSKGCMIYGDKKVERDYTGSIRYRMMQEVFYSVELATQLIDVIGDRHFEVHIDINPSERYKSNAAMKEAIGYCRGMLGVEPKLKPNSFAASCAADRFA